ncbi:MarR family winged helix-turn-helix transcriptional regulator [Kitasatospora cathayae]|uniref:MarR family transcriptional regulator n=1 Tax=Kitasatospora cathayae TaxID=3004092 RepID=A0ABY7QEI9_9ACTN|nr:MarR family transcriptional regulator [Kitasatospora sp. HUAS 3-15]WBP91169.1 MarR family transcriptional regulator [Kitasatospora sp. HUAS 3-15]
MTADRTHSPRASHDELRYLLLAAQREGSRRFGEALRPLGLTPPQAEVLDVLAGHQPVTLAALGRLLVCEQGSPSRLVDSLVQRGLVSRLPHEQDKRAVLLELTAEGQALADRLGEATGRLTAAMAEPLSGADIATLTGLLHTLLEGTDVARTVRNRFPR